MITLDYNMIGMLIALLGIFMTILLAFIGFVVFFAHRMGIMEAEMRRAGDRQDRILRALVRHQHNQLGRVSLDPEAITSDD